MMSHNHMGEGLEVANPSNLREEEKPWIHWTNETLMIGLKLWDSHTSLPKLNEICDVLVASGLISQRDNVIVNSAGRHAAPSLDSSRKDA